LITKLIAEVKRPVETVLVTWEQMLVILNNFFSVEKEQSFSVNVWLSHEISNLTKHIAPLKNDGGFYVLPIKK
jgi:hypothetical protein